MSAPISNPSKFTIDRKGDGGGGNSVGYDVVRATPKEKKQKSPSSSESSSQEDSEDGSGSDDEESGSGSSEEEDSGSEESEEEEEEEEVFRPSPARCCCIRADRQSCTCLQEQHRWPQDWRQCRWESPVRHRQADG